VTAQSTRNFDGPRSSALSVTSCGCSLCRTFFCFTSRSSHTLTTKSAVGERVRVKVGAVIYTTPHAMR